MQRVARFAPDFLVVSLGFDTGAGDPTGSWPNRPADFARIGRMIAGCGESTLIVQEGGYRTRTIGANARHFFEGLIGGAGNAGADRAKTATPATAAAPIRPR